MRRFRSERRSSHGRRAVFGALLFATSPYWVHPLCAQSAVAGEATLTGELVRFPDASVNVSVFSPNLESIPLELWERVADSETVALLPGGDSGTNDGMEPRIRELLGGARVLVVTEAADLEPVGVQVTPENRIRLAWYGLSEQEGVAVLADARAVDAFFSLRILIPNPTDTEDWWGLQAALSQAGIRRVQILSGRP
jgi:hypothetical protein